MRFWRGMLASRLSPQGLNILFQVCLGLSGLRVPVSPGVLAVSSRTVMNNVGYQDAKKARQLYRGTHRCAFAM